MENPDQITRLGLFGAHVPRYSYPTAPVFSKDVSHIFQAKILRAMDSHAYVHIPFWERLCRFYDCPAQGTRTLNPVARYIEIVKQGLLLLSEAIPSGFKMVRLHRGGDTPTVLPPELIHDLAGAIVPPDGRRVPRLNTHHYEKYITEPTIGWKAC